MNVFKFLSATLLAGTCLFSSCKKEKSIVPENPSVVEITVSSSKGELLGNETVRMYDETSYKAPSKGLFIIPPPSGQHHNQAHWIYR